MDNKTYDLTIEGQRGTFEVKGLTMNGTNYVSEAKVDTESWPAIFSLTVKDKEGNITEHHDHAKLLQQVSYEWDGGKWYLAFGVVSEQEVKNSEFRADINETNETALTGLMAATDLYEELVNKGVLQ